MAEFGLRRRHTSPLNSTNTTRNNIHKCSAFGAQINNRGNADYQQNLFGAEPASYPTRRLSAVNDDCRNPTPVQTQDKNTITIKDNQFLINDESQLLIGATFQWFRQAESRWDRLLDATKACGFNMVDMYIPWSEIVPNDPFNDRTKHTAIDKEMVAKMCRFLEKVQAREMNVYFRPGPYICDEYDAGGVPGYVRAQATKYNPDQDPHKLVMRSNNPKWLAYCEHYLSTLMKAIGPYLKTNGGPILAIGIENEPDHAEKACIAERFLATKDGHAERQPIASPVNRAYYESLMRMIQTHDSNIPITLCAGEPHISATDGTPDLIVLPNNYQLKDFSKTTRQMLLDNKNPRIYEGKYAQHPTGYTEIPPRSTSFLTSALVAGAKIVNYFNAVGYGGAGKNSIIADPTALGVPFSGMSPLATKSNLFEFSRDRLTTLGLSLPIWYINQYMNCYGPIGALGTLPEKFNAFRRNIMSALTLRSQLGPACKPERTWNPITYAGHLYDKVAKAVNWCTGWRSAVSVAHDSLGCREAGGLAHYWNTNPSGSTFLQIMNQTGKNQILSPGSVTVKTLSVPKHYPMAVGTEYYPGNPIDLSERDYAVTLPFNIPMDEKRSLNYATAGLLTNREFNGNRLLVLYGEPGSRGECEISCMGHELIPLNIGPGFEIHENQNGKLNVSFDCDDMQRAQFMDADGKLVEMVAMNRSQAGKCWFHKLEDDTLSAPDVMITGIDFIKPAVTGDSNNKTRETALNPLSHDNKTPNGKLLLETEHRPEAHQHNTTGAILSAIPLDVSRDGKSISHTDHTGITRFLLPNLNPDPAQHGLHSTIPLNPRVRQVEQAIPPDLTQDRAARAHYGNPLTLDNIDVHAGRAIYQTEINLSEADINTNPHLTLEHASGLTGIYVNDHYVSTLAPLGGEINTKSWHPRYQMVDLKPFLKPGKNTISFRSSIWGNGSFGSPTGKIRGLGIQLPAISMEAPRGLYGEATLCGKPLKRWWMKAESVTPPAPASTPAQNKSMQLRSETKTASNTPAPIRLAPGSRQWTSVTLDPNMLPSQKGYNAPQVLRVTGKNAMVSAYYKGEMIGRVITDDGVVRRGTWTSPTRELWSYTRPDHIPLPMDEIADGERTIDILIEDMSDRREPAGEITELALCLNEEELGYDGENTVRKPGFTKMEQLTIEAAK